MTIQKGSSALAYFADASNEEKQTVVTIIRPMPYRGIFKDGESVKRSDICDGSAF